MLQKTTQQYAFHDIALECDIYEDHDHIPSSTVFLYFHPGSLTGGTRAFIPPWLVQYCLSRDYTLISASYRFLPQVSGQGLVDDALAAYRFAKTWKVSQDGPQHDVIVGGASAGFFMANLVAHHYAGKLPIAMLCITGIPTFRDPFYVSSILLSPQPIEQAEVEHWLNGPLVAGDLPDGEQPFVLSMLAADGTRNESFKRLTAPESMPIQRWDLYDFYVHNNSYPAMLGDIDPGFDWTKDPSKVDLLKNWPPTVFIQGGADVGTPIQSTIELMGKDKAMVFLAADQPHLFEANSYLSDDTAAMEVVRAAVLELDRLIQSARKSTEAG